MSLAETLRALADPTRHRILTLLKKKDMSAGEIGSHFRSTAPTLSHHLGVLKQTGLIQGRREGQEVIYSLNLSVFEETADALLAFFGKSNNQISER